MKITIRIESSLSACPVETCVALPDNSGLDPIPAGVLEAEAVQYASKAALALFKQKMKDARKK